MTMSDTADSARASARGLMRDLERALELAIPADGQIRGRLEGNLTAQLARVGRSNVEDLCSWILLECLQRRREGALVDWSEVLKAADRIRHRIARRQARERPLPLTDAGREDENLARSACMIDLRTVLARLDWEGLFIFESALEGAEPAEVAIQLGKSRSYVYHRLAEIKQRITSAIFNESSGPA